MIIDSHVHLQKGEDSLKELLVQCDRLGIDKIVLMGGPEYWGNASDEEVIAAHRSHPDRIIPLAFVRFGYDPPSKIDQAADQGCRGLKTGVPKADYADHANFVYYEKASEHNLPILFHLGIVARKEKDPEQNVNSNRMRPIHLDTIARAFPELRLIGAHLGNPWYEEATMSARWNENLWFDLSGSTLKKKSPHFLRKLLWWDKPGNYYLAHGEKHPFEKILFGTDVTPDKMEDVFADYRNFCDELDLDEKYRRKIFGENAAEIFGIPLIS